MKKTVSINFEEGFYPSMSIKGKVFKIVYVLILFSFYLISLYRFKKNIAYYDYLIIIMYVVIVVEVFIRKKSNHYVEATDSGVVIKQAWWGKTVYNWDEIEEISKYQQYYLRIKSKNNKVFVFDITSGNVNSNEIETLLEVYHHFKSNL